MSDVTSVTLNRMEFLVLFPRDVCGPLLPLLLLVGEYQLDVHARVEHPRRHRRDGPVRNQRLVGLPAIVGHPSRPVRRSSRKSHTSPVGVSKTELIR